MRSFRNSYFHRYDRLQGWWDLAARNTPEMAYLMMRDPEMRKSAGALLKSIVTVLADLKSPLPKDFLGHAHRAAKLARKSGFRRLRLDASRAEAMLGNLKSSSTGQDALKLFAKFSPGRYPKKGKP
jgi:hypothetical protein